MLVNDTQTVVTKPNSCCPHTIHYLFHHCDLAKRFLFFAPFLRTEALC